MNLIDNQELEKLAVSAARTAGSRVREMQGEVLKINRKGYRDMVTNADYLSQATITDLIRSVYPDHGFLTEEDDSSLPTKGDVIWVIDPVDGTTNYSRRHPNYTVSIAAALREAGGTQADEPMNPNGHRPIAGAIYDPVHTEMFSAAANSGSMLNGLPIRVSEVNDLSGAIIGLDWGRSHDEREKMLRLLSLIAHEVHTIRAVGSAAQALAWVACGRIDAYINFSIGPWDCAAADVLLKEAGGFLYNLECQPWMIGDEACLATNGYLLERLCDLLPKDSRAA